MPLYFSTEEEHLEHVQQVLSLIQQNGNGAKTQNSKMQLCNQNIAEPKESHALWVSPI